MAYGQFNARLKLYQHNGHITPDVEVSEGFRPDYFFPAPWLPVIRYDAEWEVWFSLTAGQVVSLNSDGHLVPAGMTSVTYTANDVGEVYNVTTGELVTQADLDANDGVTVTYYFCDGQSAAQYTAISPWHVGIMPYNAFAYYGGVIPTELDSGYFSFECDPNRPMHEKYTNFNVQATVAILCDRYIQVPYVGDSETEASLTAHARSYAHAYGDIASISDFVCDDAEGAATGMNANGYFFPGCYVCHDSNGMYIPFDSNTMSSLDIVGQLLRIDSRYPKNYLERVKTFDSKGQYVTMDQMPGSATRGMDYAVHIATDGAYRAAIDAGDTIQAYMHTMFRINLILR